MDNKPLHDAWDWRLYNRLIDRGEYRAAGNHLQTLVSRKRKSKPKTSSFQTKVSGMVAELEKSA